MKSIFLPGLALLLSLTSTTLAQENQEQSIAQFVSEIDEKMPQLLQDFSVPGAAIAIIENGEIVLQKGYGFSDIENEVKVDTKTGFNMGSISKTIAAWQCFHDRDDSGRGPLMESVISYALAKSWAAEN